MDDCEVLEKPLVKITVIDFMKLSSLQYKWFLYEIFKTYCHEFDIADVKKTESPHFICTDVNGKLIDMEITESMLQTYARMRSTFNKYANRGLTVQAIKHQINSWKKKSSILKHGGIIKVDDVSCYSHTKGFVDTKVMRLEMTKYIEKKTDKLNEKYEFSDKNILMITPNGYFLTSDDDHREVLTEINKLIYNYKYTFDIIFIYITDVLHYYKRKENEYIRSEVIIDSETIKNIHEKSVIKYSNL